MVDGGEALPDRLERSTGIDTGLQHHEDAVPVGSIFGGDAVHAERKKYVGDDSLFSSCEISRSDSDDLECLIVDVEGAAEHMRIAAEAMIPVVPGEDSVGARTGAAVIRGVEQTAERRLEAEEREHIAGYIDDVSSLNVVGGRPRDVGAVRAGDGNQIGLVLDGVAHQPEVRRGPVAILNRPAVQADHLAGENIELAGVRYGQRPPEQRVDQTESGDTGTDA